MTRHVTEAVVFVLTAYRYPDAGRCIQYCRAMGYKMGGLIQDDWGAAIEHITQGKAEVLVVADFEHLDPDRTPRIEVVADRLRNEPPAEGRERKHRTSRLNRRQSGDKRTNRRDTEA
jgi:hypothetical protein